MTKMRKQVKTDLVWWSGIKPHSMKDQNTTFVGKRECFNWHLLVEVLGRAPRLCASSDLSRFSDVRCLHPVGSLLALDTWARSRREEMTRLTVEFQRLKRLSDMFIRAHRANMEVRETSVPSNMHVLK